jgi:hypothetical protein
MARLARQLVVLRPNVRAYQQQAIVLGAEASGLALLGTSRDNQGPAPPLPVGVRWSGLDLPLLDGVLADAIQSNYAHAATAACDELGRRRDTNALITTDGQPSPLASALAHGDRRVRFAALRAIMALDPPTPFAGSSRVPEALVYFARAAGEREAIVAMPNPADATDLSGKLAAANLHGESTIFGSDVTQMAAKMSDLEVIFVDMNIQKPGIRQVLYELRISPASAHVPVAVLAADGRLEAALRIVSEHDRMIAVPRPHTSEAAAKIAERLASLVARESVTSDERAQQAVTAIAWTAQLLQQDRSFYALRREGSAIESALYHPATSASAIEALSRFRTPASQRALANFASQRTLPIEARKQAAAAFDASVRASGVLLTSDEILAQYAIHNASATADSDTQQVLAALLDAIESRRAKPIASALNP